LPDNLQICRKITGRHLKPSSLHKIRVKLATQVRLQ
jgi:hypothetical protein